MPKSLLYAQLFVLTILATFHSFSIEHSLYWRFLWIDTVAHSLGGMWAALFTLYIFTSTSSTQKIVRGIAGAVVLGVIWEIFEITAGVQMEESYVLDTTVDLIMDTLGGLFAALFAIFLTRKQNVAKSMV